MQRVKLSCILIFSIISLFFLLALNSCAGIKLKQKFSQFKFQYEGSEYRIDSITSEEKKESFNRLIGPRLVALDYNKDQTIDYIAFGEVSLGEAQQIYDYGILRAGNEGKLRIRDNENGQYIHENHDYRYELSSYQPNPGQLFNELKIIDKHNMSNPVIAVFIDHHADGVLDEALKGTIRPEAMQSKYTEMLEEGLAGGDLVKVGQGIVVKKE